MSAADGTPDRGYLLANRHVAAGARLAALGELFDPVTFRHVDALGLRPGGQVWEVGAGGPAVPLGLAERVGPGGRVLATDLDLTRLGEAGGPALPAHVEVRQHDVGVDPAPGGGFDLVHARLVLVHVPQRERALASMVEALRPGGVLLLEDADPGLQPLLCIDEHGPEQVLANRLRAGFRTLMAGRGADLAFGRSLPRLLRGAGLSGVGADAWFPVTSPACAVLEVSTVQMIRDQLVAAGLATDDEVERHLAAVTAGRLDCTTAPLVSAWGRR